MQETICVMRAAENSVIASVLKVIKVIIILYNSAYAAKGVTEAFSHSHER